MAIARAMTTLPDRRHFLRLAAITATAGLDMLPLHGLAAQAPLSAIARASTWINSSPVQARELGGLVVVVQFGTFTCINWLRTLPHVRDWAARYQSRLTFIGVHTPEFPFEHDESRVRRAIRRLHLEHPIVLDNDYAIWRAFSNDFWPALYLVDASGRIRHRHFGEGGYAKWEGNMQRALGLAKPADAGSRAKAEESVGVEAQADWDHLRSGEIYTGYARTAGFASPGALHRDRPRTYVARPNLGLNEWALAGEWTVGSQAAVLRGVAGSLSCRFHARDLHLVMAPPPEGPVRFRVLLDGQSPANAHGQDVDAGGAGVLNEARLHQLIRQSRPIVDRHFAIEFLSPGVEAYALTFG